MKTARILFSVDVKIPDKNPNTEQEGPGPVLLGFLERVVPEQLSEAPGNLSVPWKNGIGDFKLRSVHTKPRKKATTPWMPVWDVDE